MRTYFLSIVFALTLWSLSAATVHADYIFTVSLNTAGLSSDKSLTGPFGIDFELNSGGGAADNTATISDFNFGGGSPSGSPDSLSGMGGLSGLSAVSSTSNLSSTVVLTTSNAIGNADFNQGFTPVSTLSFQVDLTTNNLGASAPDSFTFTLFSNYSPFDQSNIFTNSSTAIPTTDTLASTLLSIDITSSSPSISTYSGTDPSGDPSSPVAAPQGSTTPEPPTLLLSAISLASFGLTAACRRLRRRE